MYPPTVISFSLRFWFSSKEGKGPIGKEEHKKRNSFPLICIKTFSASNFPNALKSISLQRSFGFSIFFLLLLLHPFLFIRKTKQMDSHLLECCDSWRADSAGPATFVFFFVLVVCRVTGRPRAIRKHDITSRYIYLTCLCTSAKSFILMLSHSSSSRRRRGVETMSNRPLRHVWIDSIIR